MIGAIIASALSAVANGIGTHLANKKKTQAQEAYRQGIDKEVEAIDNEINSNYLDRADARAAIRQVTNASEESLRQLNTDAIRSGATDEAKVAMASALNKNLANTIGTLAGVGEQHKDNLKAQKRSLRLRQLRDAYATDSDTSGITSALQGISNAATSIGNVVTAKSGTTTTKSGATTTDAGETSAGNTILQDVVTPARAAVTAARDGNKLAQPVQGIIESAIPSVNDLINTYNKQIPYGK